MSGRYDKIMKTGFMPLMLVVAVIYFYFQVMENPDPAGNVENPTLSPYHFTLKLTSVVTGNPEDVVIDGLSALSSGEANMHGCFKTTMSLPMMTETYKIYDDALPVAPVDGLACFDAKEISAALAADTAFAFLSQSNIATGIDRVVAVYDDGRAFVWNQPNNIPNNINE